MKSPDALALQIAKQVIPTPMRSVGDDLTGVRMTHDTYDYLVESAARTISFNVMQDRAAIRNEMLEVCALIAETEHDERWDDRYRNAGIWIGGCIRRAFGTDPVTNNVTRKMNAKKWFSELVKRAGEQTKIRAKPKVDNMEEVA